MGIGSSTTMRDQQQQRQTPPRPSPTTTTTTTTTDSPLRITREYRDFGAPTFTPRGGSMNRTFDARSPTAGATSNRPPGQRLELPPAVRARIEANRLARGASAAGAGRTLRSGSGGRGGGRGGFRPAGGPRQRRPEANDLEDGEHEDPAEIKAKVDAHMAPPPREWLDHVPEELSLEDLRLDWPSVPTGPVGMVTGVEEKLRWMARRMQHGYDSPHELAYRLHKGGLVQFESEEEKVEVLKLAQALEEKKASELSERTGEEVETKPAGFSTVNKKTEDTDVLSNMYIKGIYPTVADDEYTRNYPFLKEVVRVLGNNETYGGREGDMAVKTIQKFLKRPRRVYADRKGQGSGAGTVTGAQAESPAQAPA